MSLRPSSRAEARRKDFKKAVDAEESRRKREDHMTQVRREKRDESLARKRQMGAGAGGGGIVGSSMDAVEERAGGAPGASGMEGRLARIPQLVHKLRGGHPQEQFEATKEFRKLLSIEHNPPIDVVIQAGVVPDFVEFLKRSDHAQLQFESAWALTNIASGTNVHTKVVIDHGAMPIFVQLLGSPSADVREQAVWALGNIAGDSAQCRDLVLMHSALLPLLRLLDPQVSSESMLRNATWTLSNFCRGKPPANFDQVRAAIPVLANLTRFSDQEVVVDACWALSYLSDGTNDRIQAVIDSGVVPRLVELLKASKSVAVIPALRTIGNIVTGDDAQTQLVIDCNALPCLHHLLLNNTKKSVQKESCWTLSNITAGNQGQIDSVIKANLFPPLVHLLQNADFDIKKEAAWAISNTTSGGAPEQIKYLVSCNAIKPLCDLLQCHDTKIISVALEGLENILKIGENDTFADSTASNPYATIVDECDGLEKVENLQNHENNEIYEKSVRILETYFGAEEEDEALQPKMDADGGTYQFNVTGGSSNVMYDFQNGGI